MLIFCFCFFSFSSDYCHFFVASSFTHRLSRLFQALYLLGINRPPLSLKRCPWSWSSTSISSIAYHQSFTSWNAGSVTQSCPALCDSMHCCPTRQSSEPPRKFYILVWTSLLASWFFWVGWSDESMGTLGTWWGKSGGGGGTLGSKQWWNGRSSLLEQATRSSLLLGTSHILLCPNVNSLLFAPPLSTLIMPTPHNFWWKFFLQKHSGTDYPCALCSLLAPPRLVFGICLQCGLGTDLAHIASPGAQVCAQLIPKLNHMSSLPPGAASRWDSQAHQASDLPGAGVWRSRGPVQLQGGSGGGAFLQKSTLGQGERGVGQDKGSWRHR